MPTQNELTMLQSLPLDIKIEKTKARIREWVYEYGINGVYVSYSGGKDSIVLLDIARKEFPEILAVFCDTGLEYPEVKEIVKKTSNVITLRPKMLFKDVIEKYGYPVIAKDQSLYIYDYRNTKSEKFKKSRWEGDSKGRFKISEKWKFLVDAPFKISSKCCDVMKKRPFKKFEKETNRVPLLGTMAGESMMRKKEYLKYGCNSFDTLRPKSSPIGFWKDNDILQYIVENKLEIPSVYGDIIKNNLGIYETTGNQQTGCMFCMYGCHLHKVNNFQRMKITHPKIYDFCIKEDNGLGLGKVLDYIGVKY